MLPAERRRRPFTLLVNRKGVGIWLKEPPLRVLSETDHVGEDNSWGEVMMQPTVPLVILFADISGSTHLYEVLGDTAARQRVGRCLSFLTKMTHENGGTAIKTIGDAVLSTFPSANAAVQAARAMQEALAEEAPGSQLPLAIRVGLHFGLALVEAEDIYGDAVNVAARIVGLAKAEQILATRQTVELLTPELRARTRYIDRAPVKGKQEEIDLYEVIWQETDLTPVETLHVVSLVPQALLRLHYRDRTVELNQSRPVVTMGRGQQNDLVVQGELISRFHVCVEYRRGKFVLLDQSTNGTFVITQAGERVYVHREELLLQGTGVISLGRALAADSPEAIHFSCGE